MTDGPTLGQLRAALKSTIKNGVTGTLHCYDTVEDLMHFPAAVIEPASSDFNGAMNQGTDVWMFHVIVICKRGVDAKQAQHKLDEFVGGAGDSSIRMAIQRASNLGLDGVDDACVDGVTVYGLRGDLNKVPAAMAVLKVRVVTSGDSL